jgi:hypothetical protein
MAWARDGSSWAICLRALPTLPEMRLNSGSSGSPA